MNLRDDHLIKISQYAIKKNSATELFIKECINDNLELFNYFNFKLDNIDLPYTLVRWASSLMIIETNCEVFTKSGIIKYNNNYGPLLLNKSMIYDPIKLIDWAKKQTIYNQTLSPIDIDTIEDKIKIDDAFCTSINAILELDKNLNLSDYYKIWFILSFLYYAIFVNQELLISMLLKLPGAIIDWTDAIQKEKQFSLKDNIGKNIQEIQDNFEKKLFAARYWEHNYVSINVYGKNAIPFSEPNGQTSNLTYIQTNKKNPRMFYHKPYDDINGDRHCCTRVNALYYFYLFGSIERNKQFFIIDESNNSIINRKVNIV